jgi:hypothetical protein
MRRVLVIALLLAGGAATLPSPLLAAQPASQPPAAPAAPSTAAPSPAGRWEGKLATPMQTLDLTVDIVAKGSGWEGVITIPAQNLTQFPLTSVTAGDSATFAMAGPGNPQFTGKIDATGKTWTGEFTQGDGRLPLSLTRTGDAKIDPPKPSTAIGKELEGSWEGSLDAGGRTLRLVLKLATGPDGLGQGTLVSVDQGNAEIKIQTITLAAGRLTLFLPTIAGSWDGELKGEQLEGTWKQGPGSSPLTFKRAVAK